MPSHRINLYRYLHLRCTCTTNFTFTSASIGIYSTPHGHIWILSFKEWTHFLKRHPSLSLIQLQHIDQSTTNQTTYCTPLGSRSRSTMSTLWKTIFHHLSITQRLKSNNQLKYNPRIPSLINTQISSSFTSKPARSLDHAVIPHPHTLTHTHTLT